MTLASPPDLDRIKRHREIWAARPELRSVYGAWFHELLESMRDRTPVVEIGAGPGFFKQCCPQLISTDLLATRWVDLACDAGRLPFRSESIGGLVMLDVLHHLPKPMEFFAEAGRVLKAGGRLAMIEPWITPFSFLIYRYLHHEDCHLTVDLDRPFGEARKNAFAGNAALPYRLLKRYPERVGALELRRAEQFLALAYLVSLGFKCARPIPGRLLAIAALGERLLGRVGRLNATRILCVWEKG